MAVYLKNILLIFACIFLISCDQFFTTDEILLSGDLFINEIVSNDTEDWIEIYNSLDETVELSGMHVSDTSSDLAKWQFPDKTYISAKGYFILVLDGLEKNGSTSFKLSAGSEGIHLTDMSGDKIDGIYSVPDTGTGSYRRTTDGGSTWAITLTPTRGTTNN